MTTDYCTYNITILYIIYMCNANYNGWSMDKCPEKSDACQVIFHFRLTKMVGRARKRASTTILCESDSSSSSCSSSKKNAQLQGS